MRSHRTASANNKGGVAKTANVVFKAGAIARQGYRVLVIDMDPQANATRRLATVLTENAPTVSEVITNATKQRGCAVAAFAPCGWQVDYAERITIIPAAPDLVNRAGESHHLGAVRRLAKALDGADDEFDVTLIDCEPSLGHLTQMALAAADDVLIATEPEFDSVESAMRLREFIELYLDDLNPLLKILGVTVVRVREQLAAHKYQLAGLSDAFGAIEDPPRRAVEVWSPTIPERSCVKDANEAAVPVEQTGRVGREVAALYDQLALRYLKATGVMA